VSTIRIMKHIPISFNITNAGNHHSNGHFRSHRNTHNGTNRYTHSGTNRYTSTQTDRYTRPGTNRHDGEYDDGAGSRGSV